MNCELILHTTFPHELSYNLLSRKAKYSEMTSELLLFKMFQSCYADQYFYLLIITYKYSCAALAHYYYYQYHDVNWVQDYRSHLFLDKLNYMSLIEWILFRCYYILAAWALPSGLICCVELWLSICAPGFTKTFPSFDMS